MSFQPGKWMLRAFAAAALLAAAITPVFGSTQQETPPEFERAASMINKHIRVNHIPGVTLGIVRAGQVEFLQAFGNAGDGRSMEVDTPLFIASLSKPITALAVMQLVESGQLELDAPVQNYIPWFQVADPDVSGRITIRHLLNQTSGLSDMGYMPSIPAHYSIEQAVRALDRAEPVAEPGERFNYFNSNYTILGLLIETVSGQPYGEYMQEHVFEPLDMRRTFTSLEEAQAAGLAQGHIAVFGYPVPRRQVFLNYDVPAGFILSTAEDMSHFLIPHLEGGVYRGRQILLPHSIELMHQTPPGIDSPYGMGWWIGPEDLEPRQMQHGGDLDAFHGDMVIMPDLRQGFVVLYNQNHLIYSIVAFNTIRDGVISLLTGGGEPFTISLTFFYRIAMIGFLMHVILVVRSFARLSHWLRRARTWSLRRTWVDVALNFLIPVVLLIALPAVIIPAVGRGFNWDLLFNRLPVLVTWIFFVVIVNTIYGLGKIYLLLKSRQSDGDAITAEN
jgi:CubicO group peptidase (beta-lactamase class C family)